jgi:hypothetical protein
MQEVGQRRGTYGPREVVVAAGTTTVVVGRGTVVVTRAVVGTGTGRGTVPLGMVAGSAVVVGKE